MTSALPPAPKTYSRAGSGSDRTSTPSPAERNHSWFAICVLTLLAASDYKVRVRDPTSSFSSQIDFPIVVEIGAYGAVLLFLLARHLRLRIVRVPSPMVAMYALVAIMLLSLLRTDHLEVEAIRAAQVVIVLCLVVTLTLRGGRDEIHYFLHAFLVFVVGSVLLGLAVPMPRFSLQQDRFTWLRVHPTTSGVYVGVATVIAVAYVLMTDAERPGPRWPRWVYAVLGAVVAGALYANKTRGAVLGAVVGLVVLAWFATEVRRRLELLVFMLIALVGFALAASASIIAYVQRGETAAQLASLNSRTQLWGVAWSFIREKPLYGYGLGASHSLFLSSTGLGGAHNALINVLTDLGIVGTLVWLWLIFAIIRTSVKARRAAQSYRVERALLLGLMALMLVNGVSNGGLGDEANISSTLLFVLAGWSCLAAQPPDSGVRAASRNQ